ncbi:MAG: hypothetical protein ACTIDA_03360 [Pseudolactococcus laudensis]
MNKTKRLVWLFLSSLLLTVSLAYSGSTTFFETENVSASESRYATNITGFTWQLRDDYIDVGVAFTSTDSNAQIR